MDEIRTRDTIHHSQESSQLNNFTYKVKFANTRNVNRFPGYRRKGWTDTDIFCLRGIQTDRQITLTLKDGKIEDFPKIKNILSQRYFVSDMTFEYIYNTYVCALNNVMRSAYY